MSYSASPSLVYKQQRQASVERNYMIDNNKDNGGFAKPKNSPFDYSAESLHKKVSYGEHMLKSLERRTMGPLVSGYFKNEQLARSQS